MTGHAMLTAAAPLCVAMPVLGAGLVLVAGRRLPRPTVEILSLVTVLATGTLAGLLAVATLDGRVVSWVAGWQPRHGHSVGIVFVADPAGACLACLAAVLTCAALCYGWWYFPDVAAHYHALLLLFLAGMAGYALTGDLFDMFVFFELMGAVAYALTGIRVEEPESVQGGLTFGVVNSLGAYLTLMGIGLVYARTGQLGLAQIGDALPAGHPDGLVVAAFLLVCSGWLVKAAAVPFHLWLADAHAVAPTPVCVLFSGVMAPLGVYGIARVYWTVFDGRLVDPRVRAALIATGVATACLGAVMCLSQRHLKRLLAYSTVAHLGLFLTGVGLLTPDGLAGAGLYLLGHAGVKGALFLLVGMLLNRYGSVDEVGLHGRCGGRSLVCWLYLLGGLVLAGVPPFGPGLGKALAEEAAGTAGYAWLPGVFVAVSAATGAAVLRSGARVFLGLGRPARPPRPDEETTGEKEQPETGAPGTGATAAMLSTAGALLGLGMAVGLIRPFTAALGRAADQFTDRAGYLDQVLHTAAGHTGIRLATDWTAHGLALGAASAGLALLIAGVALAGVPSRLSGRVRWLGAPMHLLHRLHSGHVGDYVAWLFAGVAALALILGLPGYW